MDRHGGSWSSTKLRGEPVEVLGGSMEASMDLHGAPWRSVEVHGDLRGPPWRPPLSLTELHGDLHGPPWRPPRSSMSLRGDLHGVPWRPPWRSVEASMELRRGQLRGGLHGVPDNVGRRWRAHLWCVPHVAHVSDKYDRKVCDSQFSTRWCTRDAKPYCDNCFYNRHFGGQPTVGVREWSIATRKRSSSYLTNTIWSDP